jgi:cold-inducible RNA-binding protein
MEGVEMGKKIFVGNLPFSMGETELRELFAQKGAVDSVTVMRDVETGRSRGFAFVEMANDAEALKAIEELNSFSVEGRNLTVNEARPKTERRGGFGGGRGGNRGGQGGHREPRW